MKYWSNASWIICGVKCMCVGNICHWTWVTWKKLFTFATCKNEIEDIISHSHGVCWYETKNNITWMICVPKLVTFCSRYCHFCSNKWMLFSLLMGNEWATKVMYVTKLGTFPYSLHHHHRREVKNKFESLYSYIDRASRDD